MKNPHYVYLSKHIRPVWIALMIGLTTTALAKVVFFPEVSRKQPFVVTLRGQVDLAAYQFVESRALSTQDNANKSDSLKADKQYQYKINNRIYKVELRYFVNTEGSIKEYLDKYKGLKVSSQEIESSIFNSQNGYYSLMTRDKQAVLNACINPNGGSTVTVKQFKFNRTVHDIKLNRFIPWLLGKVNLKDDRCLWTYISTPIASDPLKVTYRSLEEFWKPWDEWWTLNFPNP